MAEALTAAGLAPSMLCYRLDRAAGLALVEGPEGQQGLLFWASPEIPDQEELLRQIFWGPLEALAAMAEASEFALGFSNVPDVPLISKELRTMAQTPRRATAQPSAPN